MGGSSCTVPYFHYNKNMCLLGETNAILFVALVPQNSNCVSICVGLGPQKLKKKIALVSPTRHMFVSWRKSGTVQDEPPMRRAMDEK